MRYFLNQLLIVVAVSLNLAAAFRMPEHPYWQIFHITLAILVCFQYANIQGLRQRHEAWEVCCDNWQKVALYYKERLDKVLKDGRRKEKKEKRAVS